MATQLPAAENLQPEKKQEAVAGGAAAGMAEIAGKIWKELGEGIVAGAAAGALKGALANNVNFQEIPLNFVQGKKQLNTGAIVDRFDGQTHLGTAQFSINPP